MEIVDTRYLIRIVITLAMFSVSLIRSETVMYGYTTESCSSGSIYVTVYVGSRVAASTVTGHLMYRRCAGESQGDGYACDHASRKTKPFTKLYQAATVPTFPAFQAYYAVDTPPQYAGNILNKATSLTTGPVSLSLIHI